MLLNHVGDTGVIILGIISKVSMFILLQCLIGAAMQPIAAYNLGAKTIKDLKGNETVIFAFITSLYCEVCNIYSQKRLFHY